LFPNSKRSMDCRVRPTHRLVTSDLSTLSFICAEYAPYACWSSYKKVRRTHPTLAGHPIKRCVGRTLRLLLKMPVRLWKK